MSEITQYRLFIENYGLYKHKIYNYFYFRLSHDVTTAEDLTSDTFIKAYESFGHFKHEHPFGPWIYAIARNVLIDHLRTKPAQETIQLPEEIVEQGVLFTEILDEHIDLQRIHTSLELLPPAQREAVRLRYFEYREVAEIASLSNSDPSAVRKNISRGLETLRGILATFFLWLHI